MKFAPFVIGTLAVGAAVGWLAPGAPETAAEAQPGGEAESSKIDVLQQEQWLSGEVVLPRADDGHFYADVTVNGSSARMLVDTGATPVALTADDARAIGLMWSDSDIQPVAKGANGMVYGVPVTLAQVQLGDLEARGVAAIVVTDGLEISLLGQSFLSKIERVEMEQDRMVLGGG
jgi:aspartyl protease family protein